MYRVMVVDDEPQALKSVCRLVERRKDEFVVVGGEVVELLVFVGVL